MIKTFNGQNVIYNRDHQGDGWDSEQCTAKVNGLKRLSAEIKQNLPKN